MKYVADLIIALDLHADLPVEWSDRLEVSLDCSLCQRTNRTVLFSLESPTAQCSHGPQPPFPGRIIQRTVDRAPNHQLTATYRIEYEISPFEDQKYGPQREWTEHPTWARAGLRMACPQCGTRKEQTIQTNTGRPWDVRCRCGYLFYTERREMPVIRYLAPGASEWIKVPERFGAGDGSQG